MPNKLQHSWRSQLIFILAIIMLVSLFFSRAILSLAMLSFIIVSFLHGGIKKQIGDFFSSPVLWGMSGLFLLPLVSGLWSNDKVEWISTLRIKLPLLLLPLAFAAPFYFSKKQWDWLAYTLIILVTAGSCWTIFFYLQDSAAVNESYLRAKTMTTPLYNDHIRFSWLVSIVILLSAWMVTVRRKKNRFVSSLLVVVVAWLIIFLHIIAVRTGLFSFYMIVVGTALWLLFKQLKWKYGMLLFILVAALPWVAYKTIPSFQNRVQYILYDKGFIDKGIYLPGSTDGVRLISIKAGWHIMQEHPVSGVGFGDIVSKTRQWYSVAYPQMIEADKIRPGSEWVLYGAGCGWPGFVLFCMIMILPFFIKTRNPLLWWLLNATAAGSFLVDIGLEVQVGVFVYAFIILWWWKWFGNEEAQ